MKELGSEIAKKIKQLAKAGEPAFTVADDLYTLRVYSKDLCPKGLIQAREEPLAEKPFADCVVWPENTAQLSQLVREAGANGWALYPYGAGSGVCAGAAPGIKAGVLADSKGGAAGSSSKATAHIVVDLKRMDRIEHLDPISQVAKVQAGMIGQVLEETLNQKGFTMGHFPSSIYCSSFGGYLATRAAGQLSTYYGKMEDIVLALEGVLPDGRAFKTPVAPRASVGPDWNQWLMGSEGSFAFLTAAWVKIHALPKDRKFLSYHVSSSHAALEGVRSWLQAGLRPAAIRIYDEDESRMLMGLKSGVKLVSVVEGDGAFCEFTEKRMRELIASANWIDTGEEPAQHWWAHRYDVSYRQQQIMSHQRMILDTFEVSSTWAGLASLHAAVKQIPKLLKQEGMLVVLAHFSHFYHTGANIYFTFAGRGQEGALTADFYEKAWEKLLEACEKEGAAISHHHGIGRLKAKALARQLGPLHDSLKKMKYALDSKNILNPENLGL